MRRISFLIAVLFIALGLTLPFAPTTGQDDTLLITEVLPADGSENIGSEAEITVIFNRPVVPLSTSLDSAELPHPLLIDPPVAGEGTWINTSIYVFHPEAQYTPNTLYTVTIEAGLTAVDGAVLAQDYQSTFQTASRQMYQIRFGTSDQPGSRTANSSTLRIPYLWFYFNQPVDTAEIERALYIRPLGATSGTVDLNFVWYEDEHEIVTISPVDLLAMDSEYEAGIDVNQLPPNTLSIPDQSQSSVTFRTVPFPSILSTEPEDGAIDAGNGFRVNFASPMDAETLFQRITIEPQPEVLAEFYRWDSYYLMFPVQPRTTYTVTLPEGMRDIYGNEIAGGRVITYTTAPPSPSARLNAPGLMGFFNAYNPDTGIYLTHRNIDNVDLDLYTVPLEQFVGYVLNDNIRDYVPTPERLVRSWTETLQGAIDQSVPTYLSLGGVDECPDAPESQLNVGAEAQVSETRTAAEALTAPGEGEIQAYLYPNVYFPIVGGPTCLDGVYWWEVEIAPNTTAWAAESNDQGAILEPAPPLSGTLVPIHSASDGALAAGIYYLDAHHELTPEQTLRQVHFMMVMTANLTVKASQDEVLVWATDVQSGLPIPNAPITIYSAGRGAVAAGVTDSDGLLRVAIPPVLDLIRNAQIAVLQTSEHLGIGSTRWANGIDPGFFGYSTNYAPQQYRVFAYVDRPIYRPGQTGYFRAIVRTSDDMAYFPPDIDSVPVRISQGDSSILFSGEVPISPYGTISGEFTIPEDAYGAYQVQVMIPSPFDQFPEGGSTSFVIGEYRLPEFEVSTTPITEQVVQSDEIDVLVEGRYFFDAPVGDARVEYRAIAQPFTFHYRGEGYYQFYDRSEERGNRDYGRVILEEEDGQTDSAGQYHIRFPAELIVTDRSQLYTIEATVHDATGATVSEQTNVIVHAGLIYVGGQPEQYVGQAGEPMNINLIAVDWESQGVPDQTVEVAVIERRFHSVQEMDSVGRTTWTYEIEEIPITSTQITTGADGKAVFTFTPPNGGSYQINLTTRDEAGNTIRSAVYTWVASGEYVSWQMANNNRIDLIADRDEYQIGDTAEILITSPFQGVHEALITVERGDILSVERVTMTSNTYIYRLPITSEHVPNVFVSVVLVKGVDDTNPIAAFRTGLVQISVNTESRVLNVEITADRDRAEPTGEVTFIVRTTDSDGNPVAAEIGAALTDVASLSVIQPDQRDLLTYFYGRTGIGIRTGTVLTMNTDYYTQYIMDMIKGGGGGGGMSYIRDNFVDTPYWETLTTSDETGEAIFTITLPDNLTTWRLDVRAITRGEDGVMQVGQNTHDIVSTIPLMVRTVTPRFFVVDDALTLGAVVNNNTSEVITVDVTLDALGLVTVDSLTQRVNIPADGSTRVNWQVTVSDVESVDVVVTAREISGMYADSARSAVIRESDGRLPVNRYFVPETVATSGIMRDAGTRTEVIALPDSIDPTRGDLTINLQSSLAAVTLDGLDYLRQFPHMCVEQTVSRFLPNVMTYRALVDLGISDVSLQASLHAQVSAAIEQLTSWQLVDGGWGWFAGNESNPLTTAYTLIGLTEAKNIGIVLEATMIERAQGYLRSQLIVPNVQTETWVLNRQAFILYVLSYSGSPDIARTSVMYEWRERLNLDAQAFLLMTVQLINSEDARIETLRANLISDAVMSATGTHWEESRIDYWNWSTDVRTTAIVLKALIQSGGESDLLPNAVRWLVTARERTYWGTTQQTAWAIMALTDWMVMTGELRPSYGYSVTLNDSEIAAETTSPEIADETRTLVQQVSELVIGENNELVIERDDGNGILYYTAYLNAYLPVPEVTALNHGIIVERRYVRHQTNPTDAPPEFIIAAQVGDIVEVWLTVIAPDSLYYVVIDDPLPAGVEAIVPGQLNNQQLGARPGWYSTRQYGWNSWRFHNIEFHDDRVVLYAGYLPPGTYEYRYLVRAGFAGTFNVIPTTAQEFYFPEVYGRNSGSVFTILPAASP